MTNNQCQTATLPTGKIFVPPPPKKPQHPIIKPDRDDELEKRILQARHEAQTEFLHKIDQAISDPLQNLLSMAELEERDDYRRQIQRIIDIISYMRAHPP